jgi:DNA modification methylase
VSPQPLTENTLFYGDNLDILHEYIPNESVDLIYLDPPFNSSRSRFPLAGNRGQVARSLPNGKIAHASLEKRVLVQRLY